MYMTPTAWEGICGSRASKRPAAEGGTTLCPRYATVSVSPGCLAHVRAARKHRAESCNTSCADRYRRTIPSKDETIRQKIVRNSESACVPRSLDDDRLAVVAVEMTTRLVARPEDDDDDDEVHEDERDSAVGYHCH
ncbi:hypothetical protein HN011_002813 [Eciton burchellii]|nr:hypothetical protein HN011_002813 [Eciton burchellii]